MKQKTKKVLAVSAAATVVGVGTLATLAVWNDSEWIFGGDGTGGPGLGTSSFNVQQNTTTPLPLDGAAWTDEEQNPGGEVVFTPGALTLTPGDNVYAPVALRTEADSIAGNLTLQNPVPATGIDPGDDLWDALTYSVRVADTATDCSAATWGGFGAPIVTGQAFDTPITPGAQDLQAASGNIQYYCFEVTLPADTANVNTLQGQRAAPAWEFVAESVNDADGDG